MACEAYINKMVVFHEELLNYLDDEDNVEENYDNIFDYLENQKITKNHHELKSIIHLISKVAKNYHRGTNFFQKIEKIILIIKDDMQNNFSSFEIFNFFKSTKPIVLFLLQEGIIELNEHIILKMAEPKYSNSKYHQYFSPEIKKYRETKNNKLTIMTVITDILEELPENFYEKRKEGQNDNYICELIREDSIAKFNSYVQKNFISLDFKIQQSIYETNSYLLNIKYNPKNKNHQISLIEYAAFFGSINIFKFLFKNKVELTESLWIYAIHSNSLEIINILIDNKIKPEDKTYNKCLIEAIKCHHNDIVNYITTNFIDNHIISYDNCYDILNYPLDDSLDDSFNDFLNDSFSDSNKKIDKEELEKNDPLSCYFRYFNFPLFPEIKSSYLRYAIKYDYFIIAEHLLKSNQCSIEYYDLAIVGKKNNFEIFELLFTYFNNLYKDFYHSTNLTRVAFPPWQSITKKDVKLFKFLEEVKSIPFSVTSIEDHAFEKQTFLTNISIPFSVEYIGMYAFFGCISLKEINIPSFVKVINEGTFEKCSSLVQIIIPPSVESIRMRAFADCTSLTQVSIPSSVTKFDIGIFDGLETIEITGNIERIPAALFANNTTIKKILLPSTIKYIDNGTFENCTALSHFSIPNLITKIGYHTFYGCTSLVEINIPSSVEIIDSYVFEECTSLKEIIIPSSVTSIGSHSFKGCSSLSQISIPSSVKTMGEDIFEGCSSLDMASVVLPLNLRGF